VIFFDCMPACESRGNSVIKSTCPTCEKMRFPSPSRAAQVTESALVALATRAGVAGISELASVHSRGV